MALSSHLLNAALSYAEIGYKVFPVKPNAKTPLTEHGVLDASLDEEQIRAWWAKFPTANIGLSAEGLFVIDVDGAENPWPIDPNLAASLLGGPIVLTPRGGRHYYLAKPPGMKLQNTASVIAPGVDTRTDGGYLVAPPSQINGKSYRWIEDIIPHPSTKGMTDVWKFFDVSKVMPNPSKIPVAPYKILREKVPEGERHIFLVSLAGYLNRANLSAEAIFQSLWAENIARCDPPEERIEIEKIITSVVKSYHPNSVTTAIAEGEGERLKIRSEEKRVAEISSKEEKRRADDPGPIPDHLLRIPGYVSEVMDYSLSTAPYPNKVLAFCGALSLQSLLAARKVRDEADNRTNLYLLGLANSATGKDWPRKVNHKIVEGTDFETLIGDSFGSAEGIEDTMEHCRKFLFQHDELDALIHNIGNEKEPRYVNIMRTLLQLYTTSNSRFCRRKLAGEKEPVFINQPCLSLFGTAIPKYFYNALTEKLLSNGFFGRLIILESKSREKGQEATVLNPPARLRKIAAWWDDLRTVEGDMEELNPEPLLVGNGEGVVEKLREIRETTEDEYKTCENRGDIAGMTLWGRVGEHTRKLALIYAVSENHLHPHVTVRGVEWAWEFVSHVTRRMLFMGREMGNVSGAFEKDCQKIIIALRESPKYTMERTPLYRKLKKPKSYFNELLDTLVETEEIEALEVNTKGRKKHLYRLKC